MNSKTRIYLDYAAATPLDERVAAAMAEAMQSFANPNATYKEAREAKEIYELAKKQIGMALDVRGDEIALTSGATESDNLAILGAVRPHIESEPHVVSLATEHKSVLEPIRQLERAGARISYAKVDSSGVVDLADLENLIGESTVLVSIAYASSEIGTIQPLTKIGQLIAKVKKSRVEQGSATPLLLHSDCSAAAGLLPLSPARLGVDLLTLNASKIYGPHGCGILFVKSGSALSPIMFGGGQQNGLRPGSQDVASAVGIATALELASELRELEVARLTELRDLVARELLDAHSGALLNGSSNHRLASNINVSFPGLSGEDLVARLDAAGVAVATGAACAAASEEPSHVLLALGRTTEEAQGSLRITLGRQTTKGEVERFVEIAKQVVQDLAKI